MGSESGAEKMVEKKVIYTLYKGDQLIVVENVPARVDSETGEQFFSPDTVERLRALVRTQSEPDRFMRTPVYEFR